MEQQLILDRYRPLADLGEGGYGTVVLAWDTRMHRRVAIKRLPLPVDSAGVPQHNPPGLAEARTAAMLNHPAIVTVYDFETDEDADEALLIMEHVDGASLETVLDDLGGALSLDEAAAVIGAVSQALQFAHSNGVLHLDIKPANVLLARDGRVKVADFGMAALSSVTGHGASGGGTIGYMPLEQLEGQRVTEATDEWALAVLAFECLTGANPFDDDTIEGAIVRLETLDTPAPSEYESDISLAIDDIVLAGLGPRPTDRYQSVEAFAVALMPQLGDPGAGRDSLAEIVDAYAEEEPAEDGDTPSWSSVGLWDRLQGRSGMLLLRATAALESGWLAWAGLAPLGIERLALLGGVGLVALAAALAPSLGTGLGLLAFAVGLFAQQLWLLGAVFSLLASAWWWFFARRSTGAAVLPLSAPVLAVARVPYAMPLLAGFSLAPLAATAAGFLGGALALLASAASAISAPYASVDPRLFADPQRALLVAANVRGAFANPSAWVTLLGWALAALTMSLIARRATRVSAMLGAVAGTAIIYASHSVARQLSFVLGHEVVWDSNAFLVSLAASLILMLLVAALGAPVRAEEESFSDRGTSDHRTRKETERS